MPEQLTSPGMREKLLTWASNLPCRPRHAHLYEEFEEIVHGAASVQAHEGPEVLRADIRSLLAAIASEIEFVFRPFTSFPHILIALQNGTYESSNKPGVFVLRAGYRAYAKRLYHNIDMLRASSLLDQSWCKHYEADDYSISTQLSLAFMPLSYQLLPDPLTILFAAQMGMQAEVLFQADAGITFGDETEFAEEAKVLSRLGICLPPFEKRLFDQTRKGDYPPDLSMFATEDDRVFASLIRAVAKSKDPSAAEILATFAKDDEEWVRKLVQETV